MYIINRSENKLEKVMQKTFVELGFKEREHLQEWLANNPEALGEELLIIQKEFDGFNDTNERLDLLALDKQGNLVVIENKLDDSGRDVTWQVLKYASYCSSLSKNQIKDIYQKYLDKTTKDEKAIDNIVDFYDGTDFEELQLNQGQTQRIIMVAGKFRKEVTSTVLWLMNYKMRIQCFKVIPYQLDDKIILDVEQIIPMEDAEEYVISMAEKTQDNIDTQIEVKERHLIRQNFWRKCISRINDTTDIYNNITPSKDNWISAGSGVSGIGFNCVVTHYFARTEVYISRSNTEENKFVFDELFKMKDELENTFGKSLHWDRLDAKKACRIKDEIQGVDIFNEDDWDKMINHIAESIAKLNKVFREPVKKIAMKLKS